MNQRAYEIQVDLLIEDAAASADRAMRKYEGKALDEEKLSDMWNRSYHGFMDQLTADAGLRLQVYQGVALTRENEKLLSLVQRNSVKEEVISNLDATPNTTLAVVAEVDPWEMKQILQETNPNEPEPEEE